MMSPKSTSQSAAETFAKNVRHALEQKRNRFYKNEVQTAQREGRIT